MAYLAYHTCGKMIQVDKTDKKVQYSDTSFMSRSITICPHCHLFILATDVCIIPKVKSLTNDILSAK